MGARHTTHDGIRRWAIFLSVAVALFSLLWVGWGTLSGRITTSFVSQLRPYSTMSVGLIDSPQSLDLRKNDNEQASRVLLGNVYETLTTRTQSNAIAPGLASSWTVSQDALTYTFHLRSDLRFSNEHVLDSADVVWSLQAALTNHYAGYDKLSALSSVSADDATTVSLTLSTPDPTLLRTLSTPVGIVYDKEATYDHATTAVGSGPFAVSDFEKGSSITLQRNKHYWGTGSETSQITLRYYADDDALLDSLDKNVVQMALPSPTASSHRLDSLSDVTVVSGATTSKVLVAFNMDTESPFSDSLVRSATRRLIDTKAIVKSRADDADSALGGPISPLEPGYEDLTGLFPHDVAKAQSMMTFYGTSYFSKPAVFLVPKSYSALGTTIVDQLKQNGRYAISMRVVPDAKMADQLAAGDFSMALVADDGTDDLSRFATTDDIYHYENSEVQRLYASTSTATSEDAYETDLRKLASTISKDAPCAWLYTRKNVVATRTGVTGYPRNMTDDRIDLAGLTQD